MLIRASEAAKELDISLQRLYSLARSGGFDPGVIVRFGKRQIRFNRERLQEWVEAGGTYVSDDPASVGIGIDLHFKGDTQ